MKAGVENPMAVTTETTEDTEFLFALLIHLTQTITHLKLTRMRTGLLVNFNVPSSQGRLEAHFPMIALCVLRVLCG